MVDITAYGSDDGFTAYHNGRNRDLAGIDPDEIAGARLVASEWLDARWRRMFPGLKVGQRAQLREWPRAGANDIYGYAIPSLTVPTEVENATYEAALRQLQSPGSLSVDWTPNKYKSASVDGAVTVQYAQYSSASDVQTEFAVIGEILTPILRSSTGSTLSGGLTRT